MLFDATHRIPPLHSSTSNARVRVFALHLFNDAQIMHPSQPF